MEDEDISVTRDWDESKDWFGPASKLGSALLTSALDGHKVGPSENIRYLPSLLIQFLFFIFVYFSAQYTRSMSFFYSI